MTPPRALRVTAEEHAATHVHVVTRHWNDKARVLSYPGLPRDAKWSRQATCGKSCSRGLAADHRRVARPKCWLCRHNVARLTAQLSIAIARPSQSDHMTRPAWQETNIVLSTFIPKPGPESGGDDAVLQHSVSEWTCVGNVSEDCIGAPERSSLDLSTNKNSV